MATRNEKLDAIAALVADYRAGEIPQISSNYVDQWVEQFPDAVQEPILEEMAHILNKTYITKKNVEDFLDNIVTFKKFTGEDPCTFWKGVEFLKLQTAGNSQRDMLALFDQALKANCGFGISACGKEPHTYLYLDDVLFSGGRIKTDLIGWIKGPAPNEANVSVVLIGCHALGHYLINKDIDECLKATGKNIKIKWWRLIAIEDRKYYMANSDVLRPTKIPEDDLTKNYVETLGAAPILRTPGQIGELKVFSSEQGRSVIEQEFLKAGVRVRAMSPYLNDYMRPLGNMVMRTLGFGSTIVTYRNCPNNAPLVLWAGHPWHPLFPRKTN